jgi:type I restriction enzyme, S subunit
MSDSLDELPEGWIETSLGQLTEPSKEKVDPTSLKEESNHIGLEHIKSNAGSILAYGISSDVCSSKSIFKKGDLLYGKLRPYLNKVYLAEIDGICSTDIMVFPKSETILNQYAKYRFLSNDFVRYANANSTGVQHPRVKFESLAEFPILLPPLNEQRRIVSTIEQLTDRSHRAIAALEDVPKLIAQFRQSVLAAAFRGDLTADWREKNPDIEPASELLERIKIDSSSILKNKYSNTTSYEQLPDGWCWTRVDSVGKVSLGRQRSPKYHQGTQMRPYMRSANITWKGWDLSDVNEMNFDDRDFATFKLERGDVLINEGSGSADEVGKPAIWNDEIPDCCFQNTLISVRPFEKMSKYIYFVFLNAALSKAFVEENRGVNIHHIGKQGLTQFLIPLTSLQEQVEIVSRIEKCFQSIQSIEEQYKNSHGQLDILDRSILAKAFRGELVAQDLERRTRSSITRENSRRTRTE